MPEPSTFLTILKERIEPNEAKIIELKYTGKTFSIMSEDERWFSAKTLLLKIHAITGWTIPASNELMDILIDQFQRKLQEGYKNVTIAEVEYAFRNRNIDTQDWGKSLNLTMIDEVMMPYLHTRYDLSKMEESISQRVNFIEEPKELSESEWNEWLNDIKNYDFKILPCSAYEYLVKIGKLSLTIDQKHEYMEKAISYLTGTFEPATKEMLEYLEMKKKGVFSAIVTSSLATFAKRFALSDYFKVDIL